MARRLQSGREIDDLCREATDRHRRGYAVAPLVPALLDAIDQLREQVEEAEAENEDLRRLGYG